MSCFFGFLFRKLKEKMVGFRSMFFDDGGDKWCFVCSSDGVVEEVEVRDSIVAEYCANLKRFDGEIGRRLGFLCKSTVMKKLVRLLIEGRVEVDPCDIAKFYEISGMLGVKIVGKDVGE
jgi:hypothetical protein